MNTGNLAVKIEEELQTTALSLKDQATAIKVTNVTTYTSAGELGKSIKELRTRIVEYFKPLKEAAHQAHKAITTREAEELRPVDEALNILRLAMNKFNEEQERLRREEEARLRKIEEEKAEKERQRLLNQAVKAEEKGKDDKAEELLDRAENVYVAPVTVAPTVANTIRTDAGNITQAKEINVTVVDVKAFLAQMLNFNGNALAGIVEIKPGPLKAFVKANGLDNYPGLSIKKTTSVRL